MSISREEMITCPQCQTTVAHTVWESVNTDLSPELPNKIISGDFFAFECPDCGFRGHIGYKMLYHDLRHCAMIWLVPQGEDRSAAIKEIQEAPEIPGYVTRIVGSISELGEKVSALEAGRDDRVIEMYKLLVMPQIMRAMPNQNQVRILYTYDGRQECFKVINESNTPRVCIFESEDYDKQAYLLKNVLSTPQQKYDIVNQSWALTAFDRLEAEAANRGLTLEQLVDIAEFQRKEKLQEGHKISLQQSDVPQKSRTILSRVSKLFKPN